MDLRLELFVDDVDRSVAWYVDGLGFAADPNNSGSYRPITLGEVRLSLQSFAVLGVDHPLRRAGAGAPRGLGVEIVIELAGRDEVGAMHTRAEVAGLSPSTLLDQPWGLLDFRLSDPDGYYLRVTHA